MSSRNQFGSHRSNSNNSDSSKRPQHHRNDRNKNHSSSTTTNNGSTYNNNYPRKQIQTSTASINKIYDSNGPSTKLRGTATQIYEKYTGLARDASTSGDHILAESFMQHAEHYLRILNTIQDHMNSLHKDISHTRKEFENTQNPQNTQEQEKLPEENIVPIEEDDNNKISVQILEQQPISETETTNVKQLDDVIEKDTIKESELPASLDSEEDIAKKVNSRTRRTFRRRTKQIDPISSTNDNITTNSTEE